MFSEVCIPLNLLPLGACAHHCCTLEGLVVMRDHTNRVVVWPPPCTGENKARGVSAGSLIVKTVGSIRERLDDDSIVIQLRSDD